MGLFTSSLSPAVTVKEIDLTGVSPNVATSIAGIVGAYKWGPVLEPTTIANEGELAETFGTPSLTTAVDYFSAANFLKYSGNLIVCRNVGDSALNAVSGIDTFGFLDSGDVRTRVLIKNDDDYDTQKSTLLAKKTGAWAAKYPGALGNSLSVSIWAADSGGAAFSTWDYSDEFGADVGTSTWATNQAATLTNDEIHVVVIDRNGAFSGTAGAVLETYPFLSVAKGAKTTDGSVNYFADVIDRASQYVKFAGFDSSWNYGTNWNTEADSAGVSINFDAGYTRSNSSATETLSGGSDGAALGTSEFAVGYDEFEDQDAVDVQILIAPGMASSSDQVTVVNDLVSIASGTRKDCIVTASPDRNAVVRQSDPVNETLATVAQFTASNYLVVDNNYLKVYDKYNDQFVFIPGASATAGCCAATDANFGPWYSPAGQKRGNILGVTGLAYTASKTQRDSLYKVGINPIVQLPGQGTILFGDKTKESRPSAFDRINVRRLFLAIEKSISLAARNFLFEFNDEFTRSEFVGIVEPVLREIQARRGITNYYIQCDESNNTPAVVDRNELIASIFVKPARSINFITLNFVAVRSGIQFEEVVGTV